MRKEFLQRTYLALGLLLVVAAGIVVKSVQINVFQRAQWQKRGEQLTIIDRKLDPKRGNIYASDESLLATSISYFDIRMDLMVESVSTDFFNRNVDSLAWYVTKYLLPEYSVAEYARILKNRRQKKDRYFLIKRNVTLDVVEKIKDDFPILNRGRYKGGLILERHTERTFPFGDMARRTIGEVRANAEDYGLEGFYDEYLAGQEGMRKEQKISANIYVPVNGLLEIEPKDGYDVHTTIDVNIQDVTHSALKAALEKFDAELGCAVVMEVETGDIKAMSNLKKLKNGRYRDVQNFAVGSTYEPGSTFKLASYMALMEDFDLPIDEPVNLNKGKVKIGKQIVRDSEKHDIEETTARHAFEISSNVGAAKLVRKYYDSKNKQKRFVNTLSRMGLDEMTGIDVKGEEEPMLKDSARDWNYTYTMPWMSFGYELKMAPIQVLAFYNAVANDGYWVEPRLVKSVKDGANKVESFAVNKKRRRIASKKTIDSAQAMLEGVFLHGTADHLQSAEYPMAGKTGTTQIEYWKKDQKQRYVGSFVGYFPADNPKYSCFVMVYDPKGYVYYGGHTAGPVFKEIADFCLYFDKTLIKDCEVPTTIASNNVPYYNAGYAEDFYEICNFLGLKIGNDGASKWAVLMPNETEPSLEVRNIADEVIPNVVGMTLKDALYILERHKLKVRVYGHGKVKKQSLPAGSKESSSEIILHLG